MAEADVRSHLSWRGWMILAIGACALWSVSCSVETRYRVLTFFFEGVPRPGESPKKEAGATIENPRLEHPVSFHRSFRNDRCTDCHTGKKRPLKEAVPNLCWRCHPRPVEAKPWNHAPARVGDCRACHADHESMTSHLLIAEGKALCFLCHRNPYIEALPVHANMDLGRCENCHPSHEGGTRPEAIGKRAVAGL